METEKIKKLFDVEDPSPQNYATTDIIASNGHVSLLKKGDGTYCLRNETTGQENGRYLSEQDARKFFEDIDTDESGNE